MITSATQGNNEYMERSPRLQQYLTCCACQVPKPIEEFNKKADAPHGVQSQCRSCSNQYSNGYSAGKERAASEAMAIQKTSERYIKRKAILEMIDLLKAEYDRLEYKVSDIKEQAE